MKLLFDFFPIILFFITFKLYDDHKDGILAATAVIIVATIIQVSVSWWRQRKIEKLHLVTLILVVVFGGATLLLEDEMFIKWKPSVVNWLFALAFMGSHFIGRKTLVERMMGNALTLPAPVWRRLNLSWTGFFVVMGIANLAVVYNFDTETWVNFKLFGLLSLTVAFIVIQGLYLMRHLPDDEESTKTEDEHG